MAFLLYNLLTNPRTLHKCYTEVDEVIGDQALTLSHLSKLKYIEAAIRETLRYLGPINVGSRHAKTETIIGGKYKVRPDQTLTLNYLDIHRDHKVYGDDVEEFKPERFLDGGWEALPANAWKPFGTGARACIGRALAEQEMLMAAALTFQRFNIEMADPHYQFRLKTTLTVKPDNFNIKVRRRAGKADMVGIGALSSESPKAQTTESLKPSGGPNSEQGSSAKPLTILYGGNSGTCKAFAEDILSSAQAYGFEGSVKSLDAATEALPLDQPTLIITASYEGRPPDNAKQFVAWLEHNTDKAKYLKGVKYAVFGVGNSEWNKTFHRIPKLIDERMDQMSATRVVPAGFVDVREDLIGPFEKWKDALFPKLRQVSNVRTAVSQQQIQVEMTTPSVSKVLAGQEPCEATVLVNREIAAQSGDAPRKMHMEVRLPAEMEYRTGK